MLKYYFGDHTPTQEMKYLKPLFFALIFAGLLNGCTKTSHLVQSNLWVQNSGEYRALAFQAYNTAKWRLDDLLKRVRLAKPAAIVLDLDETCLDNSPYTGYQIKNNKDYTSEDWKRWTSLATADTVPGCVSFLKWADTKVEVFYISNRKIDELEPTIENMKAYGFPNADKDHVLLRTDESNKEKRRKMVEEEHAIVMYFGDNLNDFNEDFEQKSTEERNQMVDDNAMAWGTQYIVIPNPNYGSWESAMYNYKRGLKKAEKTKVRMENTKSFE